MLKGTASSLPPLTPPRPPPNLPCPCPASQQLCFPPLSPGAPRPPTPTYHPGIRAALKTAQESRSRQKVPESLTRCSLVQEGPASNEKHQPWDLGLHRSGAPPRSPGAASPQCPPCADWAGPASPAQAGNRPLTQLRDPEEDVGEGRGAGH